MSDMDAASRRADGDLRTREAAANHLMVAVALAAVGAVCWLCGDYLHHEGHSWAAVAVLHLLGAAFGGVGVVLVALRLDRSLRG